VNLHLSVGPVRPDGFHELTTVFHAVDLVDEVVASAAPALRLSVTGDAGGVPVDSTNIAWQAAELLAREAGVEPNVRLRIHKRIPVAGGMAGGSADAAGALLACNALWGRPVQPPRLAELAADLGSDVAFPLLGSTAVGTGRGEVLAPVACPPLHWAFAPADFGIAAGRAYGELDRLRATGAAPAPVGAPEALLAALAGGDVAAVAGLLANDLEPAALSLHPELRAVLDAGRAAGALAGIVSGSGPTCAFLCASDRDALAVAAALRPFSPLARTAAGPASASVCA